MCYTAILILINKNIKYFHFNAPHDKSLAMNIANDIVNEKYKNLIVEDIYLIKGTHDIIG